MCELSPEAVVGEEAGDCRRGRPQRRLRTEPAGKGEHMPVELEREPDLLPWRKRRQVRSRIGENRDSLRIDSPAESEVAEVRARTEHVARTAKRPVSRAAEER